MVVIRSRLKSGVGAQAVALVRPAFGTQIAPMAAPLFDFSHLTPDERIELAEQLWDSLEPDAGAPDEEQIAVLRRRRAELEADGDPGEPWEQVLLERYRRALARLTGGA
jgi:putative addiction module component (TIGR02574 family)